jgi:Mg2+ and Co2+ transporter CorA
MPWPLVPRGGPIPLEDLGDRPLVDDGRAPAAAAALVGSSRGRALLREVDGAVCASVVAVSVSEAGMQGIGYERLDLVLTPERVLLARRPEPDLPRARVDLRLLERAWADTLPDQRDASVMFVQVLMAVLAGYARLLDNVRDEGVTIEAQLLERRHPIRDLQRSLLALDDLTENVRRNTLPLSKDLRELSLLRRPEARGVVSAAGARWLEALGAQLSDDLPVALDIVEGRIDNALDQLQGERSEVTNTIVLALTVVTAALFVPTLVTGMYGMNIDIPGPRNASAFWAVLAFAVVTVAFAAFVLLRLGVVRTLRRRAAAGPDRLVRSARP